MTNNTLLIQENPADFDSSLRYYIAGPMSGLENYNYEAFGEAKKMLLKAGIDVASPADAQKPPGWETMTEEYRWHIMMLITAEMLEECGAVILLQGWPQSSGVAVELQNARSRKLPVYFLNGNVLIRMSF